MHFSRANFNGWNAGQLLTFSVSNVSRETMRVHYTTLHYTTNYMNGGYEYEKERCQVLLYG